MLLLICILCSKGFTNVIDLNTYLHMGWSEYLTCEWQFPNASSEDETQSHRYRRNKYELEKGVN